MHVLNLLRPYVSANRWIILLGLACLTVVDFLQLCIPRIIKWVVDDLTLMRVDGRSLMAYGLAIVVIAALIGVFRYVWRRCLIGTSRRVEEGLRNTLFAHLQILSAEYFDRTSTGDLMAHATNDIQHIRMAAGMGLVALTDAVVLGTAAIGFMMYINLRLTLFVLIPAPLIVFGTRFFGKKMHRLYQTVQASFADLTEVVRERFAGIRIIKAYTREENERVRLEAVSREYVDCNIQLVRITGSFFPLMMFFSNLSLALVFLLGGRETILTTISTGDFVAFISYLGLLTWPMMALGWVTNLIQRGKASLDRINAILQVQPHIADRPAATALASARGRVTFDNVSFSYGPEQSPAMEQVDFDLAPGRMLGIVGGPGSGKTTLLSLVPRLYDVSSGRILLDGTDIRDLRLADLRAQISIVPQEPFLFAGSVGANITFDAPDITASRLTAVLDAAGLTDTIAELPRGLDTVVGERGITLSGGQKQRVGLARALLQDTPLLVLDDPISQVDTQTAHIILDALKSQVQRRTLLVVSHRLAAVQFADQIITLGSGRVTQKGTHTELMAAGGYYARTFSLQAVEEEY